VSMQNVFHHICLNRPTAKFQLMLFPSQKWLVNIFKRDVSDRRGILLDERLEISVIFRNLLRTTCGSGAKSQRFWA
jgi:hypothetical protein